MRVSITPQAIPLTAMQLGASSLARALVKALTPPFEAEYATSQDAPMFPQTEEIFKIWPYLPCTILGIARLQQQNTEVRFVFIIRSHSISLISESRPMCESPALFTRVVTAPSVCSVRKKAWFTKSSSPASPMRAIQGMP